jgi:nitrogen regulatory protein PII-like uncharacterized protein
MYIKGEKIMHFIGIISEKEYEKIENELYKRLNRKEFNIINIKCENIENIKNVKFAVIILLNDNNIIKEHAETLKKIINNSKYFIINTDINADLKLLKDVEANVITCGFNSKTTITASSINQDSILVSIQRNIININGKEIEQQDKKIDINGKFNVDNMLGIIAILTIFEKI